MSINILLAGLLGCHDPWKANGKKGLAVFVIPPVNPPMPYPNGYYWLSRWATDNFRGKHTPIHDTKDMVNQLTQISQTEQAPIDFLSITGHGNATGFLGRTAPSFFYIGNDKVTLQVLTAPNSPVVAELSRLNGVLAPDALVELRACVIGMDQEVVKAFSRALGGVSVIASEDIQWGPYHGLTGDRYTIHFCQMDTCTPLSGDDGGGTCGTGQ